MVEAMRAHDGVGLAAPQIGLCKQVRQHRRGPHRSRRSPQGQRRRPQARPASPLISSPPPCPTPLPQLFVMELPQRFIELESHRSQEKKNMQPLPLMGAAGQ